MARANDYVNLLDAKAFEIANGLWKGKKPPYIQAGVIRNTNFTSSGKIDFSDVAVLAVQEKQLKTRTLIPGDIILERSGGGPEQPVGRVVYFEEGSGTWSFSNFTSRIRIRDRSQLEPRFVLYFLLHFYDSGATDSLQRRTTGIRNLDWKAYKESVRVPLWPLTEQRRIVAVLTAVQRAVEQYERLIALTAELKKTLMHKLFTGGTRNEPQKQTESGPVPQSWQIERLDTTGEVIYGIQAAVANNFEPIGTKILTNKNITLNGRFDLSAVNYFELKTDRHWNTVLRRGDLLFNWRSGSKKHVGKTAYFDLDGDYVHSSFILRIRPNNQMNGRYLYYYLNWLRESGYFVKLQTYAVNAKFNKSAVSALKIAIPHRNEQDAIAVSLEAVDDSMDNHMSVLKRLQQLFSSLLHQLMTARLCVNKVDLSELVTLGIEVE